MRWKVRGYCEVDDKPHKKIGRVFGRKIKGVVGRLQP